MPNILCTGSRDGVMRVFDVRQPHTAVSVTATHKNTLTSLSSPASGRNGAGCHLIFSGSLDRRVIVQDWRMQRNTQPMVIIGKLSSAVMGLAAHPSDPTIAIATLTGVYALNIS
uniref:Pre-mRNA-splicing factor prp46 n=1 Tax=Lygus hesperus TaxID=30085 RepID=A0A0A9W029_LYGHE